MSCITTFEYSGKHLFKLTESDQGDQVPLENDPLDHCLCLCLGNNLA